MNDTAMILLYLRSYTSSNSLFCQKAGVHYTQDAKVHVKICERPLQDPKRGISDLGSSDVLTSTWRFLLCRINIWSIVNVQYQGINRMKRSHPHHLMQPPYSKLEPSLEIYHLVACMNRHRNMRFIFRLLLRTHTLIVSISLLSSGKEITCLPSAGRW